MNRWFLAWLVAISSVVVAFFVAPTAQANATGTITGIISDSSGHGIQGAVAVLLSRPKNDGPTTVVTQATTSSTGSYHLSAPAGSYFLCFDGRAGTHSGSVGGYVSACTGDGVGWNDDPTQFYLGTPISVVGATSTPGFNIRLASAGGIAGTVTAASGGAGLAGVLVGVYTYGNQIAATTTAADGTYAVNGLLPNSPIQVCFQADHATGGTSTMGYESQCYSNQPWLGYYHIPAGTVTITPLAGQVTSNVNAALAAGSNISGTIVDNAAHGVAGVNVLVYTIADGNLATGLGSAVTDSSGNYTVKGLAPSASGYDLCFDASGASGGNSTTGYLSNCYQNVPWDGNVNGELPSATPVPVTEGATTSGINQTLFAAGAISGTVTGNGAGLGNVHIQIDGPNGESTATTSSDGTYKVSGLYAATSAYTVCFNASQATGGSSPSGYLSQCYNGKYWDTSDPVTGTTPVSVTAGSTTSGINAALARAGGLSGTVTAGGVGVQDVTVLVYSVSSGFLATGYSTVSTAADGSYTVKGLKPGTNTYRVCFDTAVASGGPSTTGYNDQCYNNVDWDGFSSPTSTTVSVTAGTITPSINASLSTSGAISGHVTSVAGGTGVGNVNVFVVPIADLATSTGYASAVTTSDGSYTIKRLPASSAGYAVCFDASHATGGGSTTGYLNQCANGQDWDGIIGDFPAGLTAIPVTSGATAAVDASLSSAGAISGRAIEAGSSAPLAGVNVSLYNNGSPAVQAGTTAPDGTYRINGLEPGDSYVVCFDPTSSVGGSPAGHQPQCYKNQPWDGVDVPAGASAVSVSAGSVTTSINASFKAAAAISGSVTGVANEPLQNASVTIYDASKNYLTSVSTDSAGHYLAAGLSPSTRGYYVCADGTIDTTVLSPNGYLKQCYNNIPQPSYLVPAGATKIPLTSGQVATADFSLPAASGISGTVVSGATPLSNVGVIVFDSHGNELDYGNTADDGTYLVGGLAASSTGYLVCFDGSNVAGGPSSTGYLSACWKTKPWVPSTPPVGTKVPVGAGATATGIDTNLGIGAALSGTLSGGKSTLDASVYVFDQAGNLAGQGYTNPDGTYQVQGLAASAAGDIVCYQVSFDGFVDNCYQNVTWDGFDLPVGAQPVVLTAGSVTTNIDETLQKLGSISGTVTSLATSSPVTRVSVYLTTLDGSQQWLGAVNTSGNYTFSGLVPGDYNVCVQPKPTSPGGPYAPECYNAVAWDGTTLPAPGATTVTVGSGVKMSGINVALPAAA